MRYYQVKVEHPLHATDRPRIKEKIPFYRKKGFHFTYVCLLLVLCVFVLKIIFKEPPPRNVIDRIRYFRNNVNVQMDKESIFEKPQYTFVRIDSKRYFLDIYDSSVRYRYDMGYDYGSVENISRIPVGIDTLRLLFTFRSLKDVPEVEYLEEDMVFKISFNKYLNDKYFVVIDPGHGGSQMGAVGRKGTIEKNITLDISLKLRELLNKHEEIITILTREYDKTLSVSDRKRISNFWNPDIFLSIHMNSSRNRKVNQTEIYYYNQQSYSVAQIIRDNLNSALNIGRGIIRRIPYGIIYRNYARYGAVLIEGMYLSNMKGEQMLKNKKYRNIIAESIYKSILEIKDNTISN